MLQTQKAQKDLEDKCLPLLQVESPPSLAVMRSKHKAFLQTMLGLNRLLPATLLGLDASHPWMVFWPVNALALLGEPLSREQLDRVGETLIACQHPDGGFGGGPGQPGHLAATYAAVMALAYTGPRYWEQINREALLKWVLRLKSPNGAIRVCEHGEADPRATYCALASTTLLGIESAELREGVGSYISQCQTYEGGFANVPMGEAHGGYAFCSLATLMLLYPEEPRRGIVEFCRVSDFERWLVLRQDIHVPGFSGRTNKLVDGCYAHWVGGCWPLIAQVAAQVVSRPIPSGAGAAGFYELFSREGLQDYLIKCCQSPQGGLRDKPGTSPDAYHSNYVLSGLAGAQYAYSVGDTVFDWKHQRVLETGPDSVPAINPVFGILPNAVEHIVGWFRKNPFQPTVHGASNPVFNGISVSSSASASASAFSPAVSDPSSTSTLSARTVNSSSKRVRANSRAESIAASPSPSSREYQGFALYVGATVVLVAYLAWALLPASWLHAARIDYYPSRWWAVAIPAFILMLMLYIYTALAAYNTEKLTFRPDAPETIADYGTQVHDVPLVDVNRKMYAS